MDEKKIIYQTFPRLFGNQNTTKQQGGSLRPNGCGKMNDYTHKALQSIRKLGCNYIWYTGIIQHAQRTDYSEYGIPKGNPYIIKGEAGSPYAITDYYSVDPDLAVDVENRMAEFDALVERTHQSGMKVIIDFVPNHVAREYHSTLKPHAAADFGEHDQTEYAFHPQNNFYYIPGQEFAPHIDLGSGDAQYHEMPAKATGNDCFHAFPSENDWYETVKLNYGVNYATGERFFNPIPDTWTKMLHILLYWSRKHVDGFRCDMAHMVPIEFWAWVIPLVKKHFPNIIFIAELYSPELYRDYLFKGHFDYLYDKVGLYDTLRAITEGKASALAITQQWQALEGIQKYMVNFLENHDEQRGASDFFAGNPWKLIPALIVSSTLNVNPFLLYFGQELGERGMDEEGFSGRDGRTTIFDYWCLDKIVRWNNEGEWNEEQLIPEERSLRDLYSKILNTCNSEKAISQGLFFDLMYVNNNSIGLNPDKQYAYLRKYKNDLLIIVVNFSDNQVMPAVRIPKHAFDYLHIPEGVFNAKELISGDYTTLQLQADQTITCSVEPWSGLILKIACK